VAARKHFPNGAPAASGLAPDDVWVTSPIWGPHRAGRGRQQLLQDRDHGRDDGSGEADPCHALRLAMATLIILAVAALIVRTVRSLLQRRAPRLEQAVFVPLVSLQHLFEIVQAVGRRLAQIVVVFVVVWSDLMLVGARQVIGKPLRIS